MERTELRVGGRKVHAASERDLLAANALTYFSCYSMQVHGLKPAAHHEVWIRAFEDPRKKRILITCPPEHAKTTYAAILYPAWRIARDPDVRIAIVCATSQSAEERSLAVQSLVRGYGKEGEMYRWLFPHVLPGDKWTASEWTVRRKRLDDPNPTVFACGVFSDSLIGKRADVIIVDDPMTEETARSGLQRERLDMWTRRTLLTRLTNHPEAKFVCIMTRWHERDMAATLMDLGFHHIEMPALGYWKRHPERALWPARFGRAFLEGRKREMGSALFDAMYMCDPAGLEGHVFRKEWFQVVEASGLPEMKARVSGWDLAASESSSADYTVKTTLGLGIDEKIYVLDVWRQRMAWPAIRRQVKEHGARERIRAAGVEAVAFQTAAVQELQQDALPFACIRIEADKDKVARALEWAPDAEGGRIRLVRASWNDAWLTEVASFPEGRYDDQVDSFSIAFRTLKKFGDPQQILVGDEYRMAKLLREDGGEGPSDPLGLERLRRELGDW
jgi:predicted phage terminase large subunit-like protein